MERGICLIVTYTGDSKGYSPLQHQNIFLISQRGGPGGVHRGGGFVCGSKQLKSSPMPHSLGTFLAEQESTIISKASLSHKKWGLLLFVASPFFGRFVAFGEECPPETMVIGKRTAFQGKAVEENCNFWLSFSKESAIMKNTKIIRKVCLYD